jgi:hypothetical protein
MIGRHTLGFKSGVHIYSFSPNPDKPEQIATKAQRHKEKLQLLFIFASWCLGGVNVLTLKAQKFQLSA